MHRILFQQIGRSDKFSFSRVFCMSTVGSFTIVRKLIEFFDIIHVFKFQILRLENIISDEEQIHSCVFDINKRVAFRSS
jgi:hypothetical protein